MDSWLGVDTIFPLRAPFQAFPPMEKRHSAPSPDSDLGVNDHVFRLKAAKFAKKIWQITMLEIPLAQNDVNLFGLHLFKRFGNFRL